MAASEATILEGGAVKTSGKVIDDFKMVFNAEGMKSDLIDLDGLTQAFRDETTNVDDAVNSTIGPDGDGFKGDYATKIFNLYESLLGSFNGFSQYCDSIFNAGTVVFSTSVDYAAGSAESLRSLLEQPAEGTTPTSNGNNRFNKVLETIAEEK